MMRPPNPDMPAAEQLAALPADAQRALWGLVCAVATLSQDEKMQLALAVRGFVQLAPHSDHEESRLLAGPLDALLALIHSVRSMAHRTQED